MFCFWQIRYLHPDFEAEEQGNQEAAKRRKATVPREKRAPPPNQPGKAPTLEEIREFILELERENGITCNIVVFNYL